MLTVQDPNKFDWKNIPLLDCVEGNALDTIATLGLAEIFQERLEEISLWKLHTDLMSPLIPYFAKIENQGMIISENEIDNLQKKLDDSIKEQESIIRSFSQVKDSDNISSIPDLINILFINGEGEEYRDGGFCLYPIYFNPTGPSTDNESLKITLKLIEEELEKRAKKS